MQTPRFRTMHDDERRKRSGDRRPVTPRHEQQPTDLFAQRLLEDLHAAALEGGRRLTQDDLRALSELARDLAKEVEEEV